MESSGSGDISVADLYENGRDIVRKREKFRTFPENRYTKMEIYQLGNVYVFMTATRGGILFDRP
jgi:hypothetical protein